MVLRFLMLIFTITGGATLHLNPPLNVTHGSFFKAEFHSELDTARVVEQAPMLVWPWTPHSEDLKELSFVWNVLGMHVWKESEVSTSLDCLYSPTVIHALVKAWQHVFHIVIDIPCSSKFQWILTLKRIF